MCTACARAATAQPAARSRTLPEYRQTAAVLEHYRAVPGIQLDSPAFRKLRPALTSQEELMAFVSGLSRDSHVMWLGSVGSSPQGRDIPVLSFTAEGRSVGDPTPRPAAGLVPRPGARQNEPAGGEAMLALASSLAKGDLLPLLRS